MTTETKDEDAASTAESAATASAAVDEVKEEAEKKTTAEVKSYRMLWYFLWTFTRTPFLTVLRAIVTASPLRNYPHLKRLHKWLTEICLASVAV